METILKDLKRNPDGYLRGHTGTHFEQRIAANLSTRRYTKILKEDFDSIVWKKIKGQILEKTATAPIANTTNFKQHFVVAPYGSQDYPDILLFEANFIIPFELKFSRGNATRPMWNSGLPRPNGIYIFGSANIGEITFFLGRDVISSEDAKSLHDHLNKVQTDTQKHNESSMASQPYGFVAYVRKAFDQNKVANKNAVTNYFTNKDKEKLEQNVIAEVARLSRR